MAVPDSSRTKRKREAMGYVTPTEDHQFIAKIEPSQAQLNGDGTSTENVQAARKGYVEKTQVGTPNSSRRDGKSVRTLTDMLVKTPSSLSSHALSEFHQGAIVKITMKNFVTYDRCELYPGPYFNMVIGPNGTGKSTIVCAIALGLGGSPSLLGRAKDVSEFVKHGHESGWVEITLRGMSPSSTTTIRRQFSRSSNKTSWKLDGQPASKAEVHRVIQGFNIQVDNLCQFLPQDRVVEFSKMTSQKLLLNTQTAVGRGDLHDLQSGLIQYRQKEVSLLNEAKQLMEDEATLAHQNSIIKRDVQRWQEREQAERQVRVLKLQIPLARYAAAKAGYEESRQRRREAQARLARLQQESGPAVEMINQMRAKALELETKQRRLREELREHDRGFRREFERINAKEREMQDLGNELKVFHEQAKRRRHEISEMQRQLGELERQRPNPPDPDAGIRVQRELDEIYDREQEYNARIEEIQQERRRIHGEGRQLDNEIAEHSYRLQQLDDVKARKLRLLDVFHADTARAVRWLEGNRGKFTRHVFSPVCLQVNVKDPRYAPVIESLIRAATLKTFVCQCRDDYMTMTREVNDRLGLKINVVALPEAQQSLDKYHPPVDPRKLSAFGFEGYALDLVDAPAPVLAYLCSAEKLHAIPISLSEVDNEGIEASRQFSSYIAAGVHYTITKARYGNHNISVNSSRVRPHARLLSSDSAEIQSERAQLIQKIDACRDQLQNNERRVRDLSNREQSILAEKARAIDPERERLRKEKEAIRRLAQQYQAHTLKVEGVRKRLQLLQQSERQDGDSRQAKQRIRDKMRDNAAVRAELVCRVAELLKTRVRLVADKSAVVALNVAGTKLRLTELEEQASVYRSRLAEAQHDLDEAKRQAEEDKVSASRLLREAQRVTETISDEERAMMQESMDPSANIEDLEARLEAAQQRLELISVSGLSARVIEEYNRRTQELKDKQRRIKEMQRAWHKLVADKVRTRQQWEDPLEELVAKINVAFTESFEAMGCKGEVRLTRVGGPSEGWPSVPRHGGRGELQGQATEDDVGEVNRSDMEDEEDERTHAAEQQPRDEEYSEWGIDIYVAFRAGDSLQKLTNNRQSGGERAVSTALYLQALQFLTTAPFRVVDEINQGMDQSNERRVYNRIIETVCAGHGVGRPAGDRATQGHCPSTPAYSEGDEEVKLPGDGAGYRSETSRPAQYFLITPKLLPNLRYHERMKVLCIYNGEWIPEKLNLHKYLQKAGPK